MTALATFDRRRMALIVELMQNDNVDPDGVYARHGLPPDAIEVILPNIARVCEACKTRRIPIIATKLTVLTDIDGTAMGHEVLGSYRPFLAEEGFRVGTWGHEVTTRIPRPDYEVRKWVFSSFHQTELEKILRSLDVRHLVLVGEATHIAVESTARDARHRNYEVTVLADCVGAYDRPFHESSLRTMSDLFHVTTAREFLDSLGA